jgi:hypothetical protein
VARLRPASLGIHPHLKDPSPTVLPVAHQRTTVDGPSNQETVGLRNIARAARSRHNTIFRRRKKPTPTIMVRSTDKCWVAHFHELGVDLPLSFGPEVKLLCGLRQPKRLATQKRSLWIVGARPSFHNSKGKRVSLAFGTILAHFVNASAWHIRHSHFRTIDIGALLVVVVARLKLPLRHRTCATTVWRLSPSTTTPTKACITPPA